MLSSKFLLSKSSPTSSKRLLRIVIHVSFAARHNLEPKVEANVADIIDNLDHLKRYELNGRQIQNVINVSATIARARTGGVLDIEVVKKLAGEASGMFKRLAGNTNSSKGREDREGLYGSSGYR